MGTGYIYKITNKDNGMVYIGKTKQNYKTRVMAHFREATTEKTFNILHRDIRKYGFEKFESEPLEFITIEDELELNKKLNELEAFYMEKYDSIRSGYNTIKNHGLGRVTGFTRGRKFGDLHKRTINVYDQYGNLIKNYKTLMEASLDLDLHKSTISNCLHKRKLQSKKMIFLFDDEELDMNDYKNQKFLTKSKRIDYTGIIK